LTGYAAREAAGEYEAVNYHRFADDKVVDIRRGESFGFLWLKFKSKTGWGLLELTRLAQTMLLERMDLWALLCPQPPDNRQPLLFNQRAGQQWAKV